MNLRPLGYEPSELPSCSTPRRLLHCRWHRRLGQIVPRGYWVVAEGLADGDGLGLDPELDDGLGVVTGKPSSCWAAAASARARCSLSWAMP